jgi:hypothetical protein
MFCGLSFAQVNFVQRTEPPDPAIVQKLLAMPPQQIMNLSARLFPNMSPHVSVDYVKADLEGSGSFEYLVAFYSLEEYPGGVLEILKVQNGSLLPLFIDSDTTSGARIAIELIDANADGIPEVLVSTSGPSGYTTDSDLYKWTGSELASLIPENGRTTQVSFVDLDGDGRLEMIASPDYLPPDGPNEEDGRGSYEIYSLEGGLYKFVRASEFDPITSVDAEGNSTEVDAPNLQLSPSQFPISQVGANAQSTISDNTPVHLFIRKLVGKGQVEVPLDQLDPSSIWIDPGIHPIQTQIVPDAESSTAGAVMLDIFLPRTTLLKRLQWLQPTAPLAVGDSIGLSFHARVKDGRTVTGAVSATIVGDSTQ